MSTSPAGLRVLLVDDEPLARRQLRRVIGAIPGIGDIQECANGHQAIERLTTFPADLVVLDIQMPGIDGLGVVRRVGPARMPPVVFVTAFDEYAVRAFELSAVDYVLKPYTDGRLRAAVERALCHRAARDAQRRMEQLVRTLAMPLSSAGSAEAPAGGAFLTRLLATAGKRAVVIPVDSILWIESDDYCATVITAERRATVRETLSALEARLDPAQFMRVHRSAIVRISAVREVRRVARGLSLRLEDETTVPVSRVHVRRVLNALGERR